MKTILITFLIGIISIQAQENAATTLRLGDFKIYQKLEEVEKLVRHPIFIEEADMYAEKKMTYKGATYTFTFNVLYNAETDTQTNEIQVNSISTNDSRLKTKSGAGIGTTKYQLLEMYKDYSNFEVGQYWDEKTEKMSRTKTHFTLYDYDAGTALYFELENNIVVKMSVWFNEGGC